jgi:DNA (cytosine-5)-methyltransferase 1
MKKSKTIIAADLFCGAGGTSTGLRQACERQGIDLTLIAINHWEIAISTHSANHPDADHHCANLDTVDPRKLVPNGKLDLLVASPECVHHSNARGGMPINDQSRASAWRVVEWLSQVKVERVLIENVPEFRTWGPLIEKKVEKELSLPSPFIEFETWYAKTRRYGGTREEWQRIYGGLGRRERVGKVKRRVKITVQIPDPKRKGEIYLSFLKAIESHGYTVETCILNAADFGDPTSRERLFIQARRGRRPIRWPEPTHAPVSKAKSNGNGSGHLFDMSPRLKPHRPAREIIDWAVPSESIFTRKRLLSPNTLARIWAGLAKFCGLPFICGAGGPQYAGKPRSVDKPMGTVLTDDHSALIQPFLVKYYGGHDAQSIDEPLPTVTAHYEHYGLAQPFIVELRGGQDARSIDAPLSTITTKGMHHALCRPFLVVLRNNADAQSLDEPLRTLAANGQHFGLAQPFLVRYNGNHEGRRDGDQRNASVDEPIPTLDTSNRFGLVQPFIVPVNHGKDDLRSHSVDRPMPAITTVDAWGLIEPFIINSGGRDIAPRSTDEPLNTVVTRDHLGLVQPFLIAMEHGGHERSIDRPLNTITTARGGAHGLVQPYLVKYNGTAGAQSVDDPLDTVTAKDRFGLVIPELKPGEEIALLDVHFRMLQPHELAAAMGFPKTYHFVGNREQKVRQIGNAVPVGLAQALCSAILSSE